MIASDQNELDKGNQETEIDLNDVLCSLSLKRKVTNILSLSAVIMYYMMAILTHFRLTEKENQLPDNSLLSGMLFQPFSSVYSNSVGPEYFHAFWATSNQMICQPIDFSFL